MLRHERRHTLRFAALQSDTGLRIRARHPEIAHIDSMIWVDYPDTASERVHIRSTAALRIAGYLGGPWRLALAGYLLPRAVRDIAYDVVARNRHRLIGGADRCYIPPPSLRARFL